MLCVCVLVQRKVAQSDVCKKTLNPVWNMSVDCTVSEAEVSALPLAVSTSSPMTLELLPQVVLIELWDWNRILSNKYLGGMVLLPEWFRHSHHHFVATPQEPNPGTRFRFDPRRGRVGVARLWVSLRTHSHTLARFNPHTDTHTRNTAQEALISTGERHTSAHTASVHTPWREQYRHWPR